MRRMFFPYLLSGYPDWSRFEEILDLACAYADTIEIGIPFSDPVADGPVLQQASFSVLSRGFRIENVFRILQSRKAKIPFALMSYANPVLAYGRAEFLLACRQSGARYVIVPDVPHEESDEWRSAAHEADIAWISFISLTTGADRLKSIAESSEGFLYLLSVTGITGSAIRQPEVIRDKAAEIRNHTNTPVALGFGIRRASDAIPYLNSVDAFIVGSRIAELAQQKSATDLEHFFTNFREVLNEP